MSDADGTSGEPGTEVEPYDGGAYLPEPGDVVDGEIVDDEGDDEVDGEVIDEPDAPLQPWQTTGDAPASSGGGGGGRAAIHQALEHLHAQILQARAARRRVEEQFDAFVQGFRSERRAAAEARIDSESQIFVSANAFRLPKPHSRSAA